MHPTAPVSPEGPNTRHATGTPAHLLLAALVSIGPSAPAIAGPSTARPNILFIMTDQQHAGMMSCTGNPHLKTPAMDSLARGGIRFDRAYVANPVCMPSRIAMASGVMPGRLGVFGNGSKAIVPDAVNDNTLGKLMQRAGYDTFYGGKTHLCRELNPPAAGYGVVERDQREALPDACIEFIRRERDRPFFIVASFINPHDICFAHAAHIGKAPKNMGHVEALYREASALPADQLPPLPSNYAIPPGEPPAIEAHFSPRAVTPAGVMRKEYDARQWQIYRWIYCRLTEQVDGHVARILGAIRDARIEDKTLILFTSDHGNMDASHRLASKGLFYDESVRVPFLMQYKGVIPAGQIDGRHLVSTGLDILPTLCEYAGAAAPETLLGKSLRPIAEGRPTGDWRDYVVSENDTGRMVRSERFKYCVYDSGSPRESLTDMRQDPGETTNLAALPDFRDTLARHRGHLLEWVERSKDSEAKAFALNPSE